MQSLAVVRSTSKGFLCTAAGIVVHRRQYAKACMHPHLMISCTKFSSKHVVRLSQQGGTILCRRRLLVQLQRQVQPREHVANLKQEICTILTVECVAERGGAGRGKMVPATSHLPFSACLPHSPTYPTCLSHPRLPGPFFSLLPRSPPSPGPHSSHDFETLKLRVQRFGSAVLDVCGVDWGKWGR